MDVGLLGQEAHERDKTSFVLWGPYVDHVGMSRPTKTLTSPQWVSSQQFCLYGPRGVFSFLWASHCGLAPNCDMI